MPMDDQLLVRRPDGVDTASRRAEVNSRRKTYQLPLLVR